MLAFEEDVGSMLVHAPKYGEGMPLTIAVAIIRRDTVNHKSNFKSIFNNDIEEAVAVFFLQFVSTIEHSPDIKCQLSMVRQKLKRPYPCYYNTLVLPRQENQNSSGIERTMRLPSPSILEILPLPKPERNY